MNKLLVTCSSLFFLGAVVPLIFNKVDSTAVSYAQAKEANINASSVSAEGKELVLRTEAINLTALGINDNKALNEYTTVELADFQVSFLDGVKTVNDGFKWGAKMSEGEGDWATVSKFEISDRDSGMRFKTTIERKHSLWYANGNYNLALVYRFNCVANAGGFLLYGDVSANTGSLVKFY